MLAITSLPGWAADEYQRALHFYQRTDYRATLGVLQTLGNKSAAEWMLVGKSQFQLGEFKKAKEAFEQAASLEPQNSENVHWLGRAYGRLAETSTFLSAPGYATKARDAFEKAVTLDGKNQEALNDLFDYYLQAPGFLGGGLDKAEKLADRIANLDAAEGQFARAQLAEKRKDFDKAEQSLRRAAELAPKQVGRVTDLAKYLAKRGRTKESDQIFEQALKMAPNAPKVMFEWASTLVNDKRNLPQARALLQRYMSATLTPDDPPRSEAEKLLRQIGS
jgi:Flp pilus assembly protein TadD